MEFAFGLSQWLRVRAWVTPRTLSPGGKGQLAVELEIPEGYYIESNQPIDSYMVPTELILDPAEGVIFGPKVYPPTEEKRFDWTAAVLNVYGGRILVTCPVRVAPTARPGLRKIRGRIKYQGCTSYVPLSPSCQYVEAELAVTKI